MSAAALRRESLISEARSSLADDVKSTGSNRKILGIQNPLRLVDLETGNEDTFSEVAATFDLYPEL